MGLIVIDSCISVLAGLELKYKSSFIVVGWKQVMEYDLEGCFSFYYHNSRIFNEQN